MSATTRDEVIQMAREAGIARWHKDLKCWVVEPGLDRFAALAAAAEREARQAAQIRVAELQEQLNRADAERCAAVLAEREACALLADDLPAPDACNTIERHLWDVATVAVGDAIRARGQA